MIDRFPTLNDKVSAGVAAVIAIIILLLWFPIGIYRTSNAGSTEFASRELDTYRDKLGDLSPIVTNRPIFDRSRRPLQAPEAPQAAVITLQLVGVLTDGNERTALVRLSNSQALHRLKDGDTIQDWTVRRINEQDIVVKKRGEAAQTIGMSN
ncbi:MAG: hypothetical protein AAGJ34_04805 [Pseudomonadota bacterium]